MRDGQSDLKLALISLIAAVGDAEDDAAVCEALVSRAAAIAAGAADDVLDAIGEQARTSARLGAIRTFAAMCGTCGRCARGRAEEAAVRITRPTRSFAAPGKTPA